jgi:hypothetical protein
MCRVAVTQAPENPVYQLVDLIGSLGGRDIGRCGEAIN